NCNHFTRASVRSYSLEHKFINPQNLPLKHQVLITTRTRRIPDMVSQLYG
ncbi:unnamed protein product, partial [Caretta caretta]